MLDIGYIRDNAEKVAEASKNKGVEVDIEVLLKLDEDRRELITQADALRAERNDISQSIKGQKPSQEAIERVRALKEELVQLEDSLEKVEIEYFAVLRSIPNMPSEDTPVGFSEDDNVVLKTVGEKPVFDFEPLPHWEMTNFIEQERAANISGARFAFIQGGVAQLEMALMIWGMQQLTDQSVIDEIIAQSGLTDVSNKPFSAMLPPMMMRTESYQATARLKPNDVTFKLADDDLWLIGSAEHSMCAYYLNDVIDGTELPVRFAGYSTSFRREVGSAGQDTRGILRVHHFNKLEMESFTDAENSRKEHEFMIAVQEYLMQKLELPYRVVLKCTFDMGGPNNRGVDIDTWMPGQDKYRETHSADLMGDYQARSLNTKVNIQGGRQFAHTNDATALADRTLIALLENYQTKDGRIRVPEVLKPYMGGKEII